LDHQIISQSQFKKEKGVHKIPFLVDMKDTFK
jgi:hypothetical protein